jgi:hypothetical protein
MEEDLGVVSAFKKVITKKVDGFSIGAVGGWGRKKGNAKFKAKKEGIEIVGDTIGRMMAGKTVKCKTCKGVENRREDGSGMEMWVIVKFRDKVFLMCMIESARKAFERLVVYNLKSVDISNKYSRILSSLRNKYIYCMTGTTSTDCLAAGHFLLNVTASALPPVPVCRKSATRSPCSHVDKWRREHCFITLFSATIPFGTKK